MTEDFNVTFETTADLNTGFTEQIVIGNLPYYDGSYEVTPSGTAQCLQTTNKSMSSNVIIRPVPSNYGLITYNGFEITVS